MYYADASVVVKIIKTHYQRKVMFGTPHSFVEGSRKLVMRRPREVDVGVYWKLKGKGKS